MRDFFKLKLMICAALLSLSAAAQAADKDIIFRNARIFDGVSATLSQPQDVRVSGGRIAAIGSNLKAETAQEIDASGLTLSPGFIDAHVHLMLQLSFLEAMTSDEFYFAYRGAQTAEAVLQNGFTTVRDMSGNSFSLKAAIDRGIIDGPRIFPSGPMISQTSGHSDHRFDAHDTRMVSGEKNTLMKYDMVQIADGRAEVLRAAREALRRLASQVKIAVGGGVSSSSDPIDVVQFTEDEIKAAVNAASDYGTYVAAHAYTDASIKRAVAAGVRTIEHGNLASTQTLRYMKRQNVWLSPQAIVFIDYPKGLSPPQVAKMDLVSAGLDNLFTNARAANFTNIAFGTDIVMDPQLVAEMNKEFTYREKWFSPLEIMRQATSKNAALLALSGKRAPYAGKLGVIEENALADILLIRGNPLDDISILRNPRDNIALIMKGGQIMKNTLAD
jgi:imidazolonepropionase-like amidohydrolase